MQLLSLSQSNTRSNSHKARAIRKHTDGNGKKAKYFERNAPPAKRLRKRSRRSTVKTVNAPPQKKSHEVGSGAQQRWHARRWTPLRYCFSALTMYVGNPGAKSTVFWADLGGERVGSGTRRAAPGKFIHRWRVGGDRRTAPRKFIHRWR